MSDESKVKTTFYKTCQQDYVLRRQKRMYMYVLVYVYSAT